MADNSIAEGLWRSDCKADVAEKKRKKEELAMAKKKAMRPVDHAYTIYAMINDAKTKEGEELLLVISEVLRALEITTFDINVFRDKQKGRKVS